MINKTLQSLYSKYSSHMTLKDLLVQIVLVYHKIRPGAIISKHMPITIIEKEIIPLLKELKLEYEYSKFMWPIFTEEELKNILNPKAPKQYSSFVLSNKKIPDSYDDSDKQLGEFLGYRCASNEFRDQNIRKKGVMSFKLMQDKNPKLHVLVEICHKEKMYNDVLGYYNNLIDSSKDLLSNYNIKLKLIVTEQKDKKTKYIKLTKDFKFK